MTADQARTGKHPETTAFQKRVYAAVANVPAGFVTTYARLAEQLGCRSAQAVGQALRANPFAPRIPCHRVIRSSGHIGGFQGSAGGPAVALKRRRLAQEGVRFDRTGRLLEPARIT
jgi:methylated-DNA-[protein]-cysteine S-methyltransferase